MAKKKGSGKKKKGSGKKGAKGKDDKKAPPRKTRCGPDFKWQAQPKLVEAVNSNNVNRAKKLMANGEDANEALHHAIGRGKISIVKAMLEAGADIHTEIKEGDYFVPPPVEKKEKKAKKKKGSGKKKKKKK